MEIIKWKNNVTYTKNYIDTCRRYMGRPSMLPLYQQEYNKLVSISKMHNLALPVMLSLRNLSRVQSEINTSNHKKTIILYKFKKFVNKINNINDSKIIREHILNFYDMCYFSVLSISKEIIKTQDFENLPKLKQKILLQPVKDLYNERVISNEKAKDFEITFEKWLKSNIKTKFLTENDIRASNEYAVTPDFLFTEDILINVDSIIHHIRWIDVKNYAYVDVPFITKSLRRQNEKYNAIFGRGCFIFKEGFQSDSLLSNVLMLDGTFLKYK